MSRVADIKQKDPDLLHNISILDAAEQADELHKLKALADTEGGKQLVSLLLKDVVYCVQRLAGGYKEKTHIELLAEIAAMSAHLNTAKLLLNSKEGLEMLDNELEELLSE